MFNFIFSEESLMSQQALHWKYNFLKNSSEEIPKLNSLSLETASLETLSSPGAHISAHLYLLRLYDKYNCYLEERKTKQKLNQKKKLYGSFDTFPNLLYKPLIHEILAIFMC